MALRYERQFGDGPLQLETADELGLREAAERLLTTKVKHGVICRINVLLSVILNEAIPTALAPLMLHLPIEAA